MHHERLEEPYRIKKPSKIFVCSMGDLFGEWVPKDWIEEIIKVAEDNPQHVFQFLTKNPKRYWGFKFPKNCWLGTTITKQEELSRIYHLPRWRRIKKKPITFISFEPLQSEIDLSGTEWALNYIDWIIIGAQTNPYKPPKREWVQSLIEQARDAGASVFLKDNLRWKEKIQEFPMEEEQ
jgi:protein gp37